MMGLDVALWLLRCSFVLGSRGRYFFCGPDVRLGWRGTRTSWGIHGQAGVSTGPTYYTGCNATRDDPRCDKMRSCKFILRYIYSEFSPLYALLTFFLWKYALLIGSCVGIRRDAWRYFPISHLSNRRTRRS